MVSCVNFFNGRTTSSLFSRSKCCWICPLTHHQQYVFQMLQFHQFFHAAGNLGILSMVIQLLFLSLHPQKKMEEWRLERGHLIHQIDGFNCGPIACLKVMELFGIVTIPYPQDFHKNYNVCKIVMGQWEELLEYCNSNLVLVFKTKPVKESKRANDEDVDANGNGLNFAPLCNSFCFTKKRNVIMKRRRSKSTMLANMFNFLPSGITKDTLWMFWERSLSKRNYLQGQVLHQRVHYQCMHSLKIESSKDSWLLKH
jgi:hypothetical protein